MAITLDEIVQAYLADTEFQHTRRAVEQKRDVSLPRLQALMRSFILGELDLQSFRAQLERVLRSSEDWGAMGFGFMMELNKLIKYHSQTSTSPETELRRLLTHLNASNMGERIEQLYTFLLGERERLRKEGKTSGMIVAPRNSAYIISLFTFWLDPQGQPIIYYESMRQGLYLLIKANVLPIPPKLEMGPKAVEVRSEADHKACLELVDYIARHSSPVVLNIYWAGSFCLWVTQRLQSLSEPSSTLIIESDEVGLLAQTAVTTPVIKETPPAYALTEPATMRTDSTVLIPNEPLHPTPEPLLTHLIHEVQRSILIDEATVRRIYHALLAGHVILTGPPGTGKTELVRIIPETLWQNEEKYADTSLFLDTTGKGKNLALVSRMLNQLNRPTTTDIADEQTNPSLEDRLFSSILTTRTAYTTRLVTATGEWSVRTLIGGITPQSKDGSISYGIQYGYLTTTILKNWSFDSNKPEEWNALRRTTVVAVSGIKRGVPQTFRGQWLVIDEFNRAPIDVALGDALTALSGGDNEALRVPTSDGSAELPIPRDFRIIGTLNSFDRTFLNQISEALKRRFAFIEILPPTRARRQAEQGIVLYKALKKLVHLSDTIIDDEETLYWQGGEVTISRETMGLYSIVWEDEQQPFREAFALAWCIFEVIRIYRQLGTAQAISLVRHMLIAGIMQAYTTREQWVEEALDQALCDTLADQLQVLLPDEIETLLLYLTHDHAEFSDAYNSLLGRLTHDRVYGQLLALGSVTDGNGQALLTDTEIERIAAQDIPAVPAALLTSLFHCGQPRYSLPQFTRRLRTFRAERGL